MEIYATALSPREFVSIEGLSIAGSNDASSTCLSIDGDANQFPANITLNHLELRHCGIGLNVGNTLLTGMNDVTTTGNLNDGIRLNPATTITTLMGERVHSYNNAGYGLRNLSTNKVVNIACYSCTFENNTGGTEFYAGKGVMLTLQDWYSETSSGSVGMDLSGVMSASVAGGRMANHSVPIQSTGGATSVSIMGISTICTIGANSIRVTGSNNHDWFATGYFDKPLSMNDTPTIRGGRPALAWPTSSGGPISSGPALVSSLPTCGSSTEGTFRSVTDSATNVWGTALGGDGSNHVLAYCDGTKWTVMAK